MKHTNIFCWQCTEACCLKTGGTCSNHWALKDKGYPLLLLHGAKSIFTVARLVKSKRANTGQTAPCTSDRQFIGAKYMNLNKGLKIMRQTFKAV
jgi:hypothetical protein